MDKFHKSQENAFRDSAGYSYLTFLVGMGVIIAVTLLDPNGQGKRDIVITILLSIVFASPFMFGLYWINNSKRYKLDSEGFTYREFKSRGGFFPWPEVKRIEFDAGFIYFYVPYKGRRLWSYDPNQERMRIGRSEANDAVILSAKEEGIIPDFVPFEGPQ